MAFDGITIASLVKELKEQLTGGRVYKIAQPETDELLLTIKTVDGGQKRLLISANASLPLLYLTDQNKPSPMTAPGFCMLLRKHLQNGRITGIEQPGLERIVHFHIEHLDEMGDLCRKTLIVELMGKHSNIIFVNEDNLIIDSIKHISGMVSSLREVLPGREYFVPVAQEKRDPLAEDKASFKIFFQDYLLTHNMPVYKAIYSQYTGISPMIAQEICHLAGLDGDNSSASLFEQDKDQTDRLCTALCTAFFQITDRIKQGLFHPVIVYEKGVPVEFAALSLSMYPPDQQKDFSSISQLLQQYYAEKSAHTRIRQKSIDLRRIIQTALERNVKKYDLQLKQMEDTNKREQYRIYGELLNTYGYQTQPGARSMEALNYYTNEMITIPLDPLLTPTENAKRYFDKYGKLKRTYEALSHLTLEVKEEIEHLESIQAALDIALLEEDLVQIKEELIESGYIRRKGGARKEKITSRPFHYVSRDGYHMYVGKNNYQNEELTFKFASGNDWWFHAKKIPGSHVIVKSAGADLPDSTFEEAARLAAHYCAAKGAERVEIDYTERRNVKKPSGSKPGFVVYYTNYSMMIDTDISGIEQVLE